jgi:hypothetical protein
MARRTGGGRGGASDATATSSSSSSDLRCGGLQHGAPPSPAPKDLWMATAAAYLSPTTFSSPPPSGAGGLLFLPSAAGRRAAGRHGRNGPSCRSSCLGSARHENWAPCSCCARNVAHNAGTTRHEVASCPSCSCCLVPVPPRARAVLGWAGQMATYSTSEGWNRIRRSMLTAPLPSSARSGA